WKSEQDIAANWQAERRFEPRMPGALAGALRTEWARAVERAKGWAGS
ncbi:MAG: hypothetical protein IT481_15655, partial [Gammaproteobacteria bacterium]|nr:hypothetical protein [Gammaproteobacteria bacterium]